MQSVGTSFYATTVTAFSWLQSARSLVQEIRRRPTSHGSSVHGCGRCWRTSWVMIVVVVFIAVLTFSPSPCQHVSHLLESTMGRFPERLTVMKCAEIVFFFRGNRATFCTTVVVVVVQSSTAKALTVDTFWYISRTAIKQQLYYSVVREMPFLEWIPFSDVGWRALSFFRGTPCCCHIQSRTHSL